MRRITRRTALAVTAGAVAAPAVGTATPAAAATTTAASEGRQPASGLNPVLRTDLVTQVTPRSNWLVTAVAIQYTHRIDLRGGVIPPSAFQVKATVGGQTAARTVTRVYSNSTAEMDDRSHPGRPGDRLIIELDSNDSNARAVGTDPLPLDRAYSVRQVEDVRTPGGEPVLKAGPFASRNDDVINPVVDDDLPKTQFEARSRALLRQARATRSHVLFTSYSPGTTPVNPHLSWAQTYENDVVIDWLFAQSR